MPAVRPASICAAVTALLSCCPTPAQSADREKTDVVVLRNGDRITGEIVQLEFGILQLKTSSMGTLKIEWPAVATIESGYTFNVERIGLHHLHGSLLTRDDGLAVRDGDEATVLPMSEVTRLSQVESGFLRSINGSISVGYNFAASTDVAIGSLAFNAEYRSLRVVSSLSVSMLSTSSPEGGSSDRDQIAGTVQFQRPNGNFWLTMGSLDRNEELGIKARVQAGGGIGRQLLQRPDRELTGYVGLSFNQEWLLGEVDNRQSLEGLLGGRWRIFRFNDPETSLDLSLNVYPSLTESGRYRVESNTTLSRELISDLTIDLSFYSSYDNRPPVDSSRSDYGIVTSLGYKF